MEMRDIHRYTCTHHGMLLSADGLVKLVTMYLYGRQWHIKGCGCQSLYSNVPVHNMSDGGHVHTVQDAIDDIGDGIETTMNRMAVLTREQRPVDTLMGEIQSQADYSSP